MKFFAVILAVNSLLCAWQIGAGVEPLYAQCSTGEMTATFVVTGILPGEALSIETMFVSAHGDEVYPSVEEMIASIPDWDYPNVDIQTDLGNHIFFYAHPADWGVGAIIDRRSGYIAFSATQEWFAGGEISIPVYSNFGWSFPGPPVADPPAATQILADPAWYEWYGLPEDIFAAVMGLLQETDVVASFGNCGAYSVIGYMYNPKPQGHVGGQKAIIIINGFCGPPWNSAPVGVEDVSWGQVKALFW